MGCRMCQWNPTVTGRALHLAAEDMWVPERAPVLTQAQLPAPMRKGLVVKGKTMGDWLFNGVLDGLNLQRAAVLIEETLREGSFSILIEGRGLQIIDDEALNHVWVGEDDLNITTGNSSYTVEAGAVVQVSADKVVVEQLNAADALTFRWTFQLE